MKIYSLDFWGTICRGNKEFKKIRSEKLAESEHNTLGRTAEEIFNKIEEIGKSSDVMIESSFGEQCLSIYQMYYLLQEFLTDDKSENPDVLRVMVNGLFLQYPPQLIDKDLPQVIEAIQQKGDIIIISSNTGWLAGDLISHVLQSNLINVDYAVYSDEIEINKPNNEFFRNVIENATYTARGLIQTYTKPTKETLFHLGDNEITDYQGSERNGFTPILITKEYTLKQALLDLTNND